MGKTSFQNLAGLTIGSWKVVSRAENGTGGRTRWRCLCACGTEKIVPSCHLKSGKSVSCGCVRPSGDKHPAFKHGGKRDHARMYRTWCNIIQRCENPANPGYADYGGRGIKICARWRNDFVAFMEDMGPRPSPAHTVDRRNNDGNYEPANCRWADRKTQSRNRRGRHYVTIKGETMPLSAAVERFGGNYGTIKWRLRIGQSVEEAFRL